MSTPGPHPSPPRAGRLESLQVHLDDESQADLSEAARLRGISPSEYVREVIAAREQMMTMTPEEQLAFWNALHAPPPLTESQKRLGALMRSGD